MTLAHDTSQVPDTRQASYSHKELVDCGYGLLFGPGNAQLPVNRMLMFDQVSHISDVDGPHGLGTVDASLDIHPDLWFFNCHFPGDPVMPGCLGLDALWQLLGFYLGWTGGLGRGRALGCGLVKFTGQILPTNRNIHYHLDIKRVVRRRLTMGIADGHVAVDGNMIYQASDLKVGLFVDPASAL